MCIRVATNNQAEYDAVIGLLVDVLTHRILHLHVRIDSLLLVMQLNGVYHVHNQVFLENNYEGRYWYVNLNPLLTVMCLQPKITM